MNRTEEPHEEQEATSSGDEKKRRPVIKTPTDLQRLKLEKLMKNPDKPIVIPELPKEKDFMTTVPNFVRNVMGSSAGAGSGEFHVYRHLRRKEYARQKIIQAKSIREQLDEEYRNKLERNRLEAEAKTAKKRAKRLKKKQKLRERGRKKIKREDNKEKQEEEPSNDEDSTDDEKSCDEENKTDENNKERIEAKSEKQVESTPHDENTNSDSSTEEPIQSNVSEDQSQDRISNAENGTEVEKLSTETNNATNQGCSEKEENKDDSVASENNTTQNVEVG